MDRFDQLVACLPPYYLRLDAHRTHDDDEEKMSPQYYECPPPTPSNLPAKPATENRTRVSSATRRAEKIVRDAKLRVYKKLDANSEMLFHMVMLYVLLLLVSTVVHT